MGRLFLNVGTETKRDDRLGDRKGLFAAGDSIEQDLHRLRRFVEGVVQVKLNDQGLVKKSKVL